jgi:hypothetical protein
MPKVRMNVDARLAIISEGSKIVRTCMRGEVVQVEEVDLSDVKSGFYSPIRERPIPQTAEQSPKIIPAAEISETKVVIDALSSAIKLASGLLEKLQSQSAAQITEKNEEVREQPLIITPEQAKQEIPDEYFVEEGRENDLVLTTSDMQRIHTAARNVVLRNMGKDKDHNMVITSTIPTKLPVFASAGIKAEGQESIQRDQEIILPSGGQVKINVFEKDGKIDVIKTLGLITEDGL